MAYTVSVVPSAAKDIRALDDDTKRRVACVIDALADSPRPHRARCPSSPPTRSVSLRARSPRLEPIPHSDRRIDDDLGWLRGSAHIEAASHADELIVETLYRSGSGHLDQ